jgi:hypothetical protein
VVILARRNFEVFLDNAGVAAFFGRFCIYCTETCSGNWIVISIARMDRGKKLIGTQSDRTVGQSHQQMEIISQKTSKIRCQSIAHKERDRNHRPTMQGV